MDFNKYMREGHESHVNEFSLLKPGEYVFEVLRGELKETKARDGYYLNFSFREEKSKHIINKIFIIRHKNKEYEEWGYKALNQLKTCLGLGKDDNSTGLFEGKKIRGVVKTQESKDPEYDDKNIISYFKPYKKTEDILSGKTETMQDFFGKDGNDEDLPF